MNIPTEIAVFLGKNGSTTKFYGEGKIVIFVQTIEGWQITRVREFSLKEVQGMIDFRQKPKEILTFLDSCKVFVALSITGIPYYFLEKDGCSIWEFDGEPKDFMDYVFTQQEKSNKKKAKRSSQLVEKSSKTDFVETARGTFSIFIDGIPERGLLHTSKQVLLPFLRRGSYETLEIVCDQIPWWLEEEALKRRLTIQTQDLEKSKIKIILKKK